MENRSNICKEWIQPAFVKELSLTKYRAGKIWKDRERDGVINEALR
jgi:hypothetical protein